MKSRGKRIYFGAVGKALYDIQIAVYNVWLAVMRLLKKREVCSMMVISRTKALAAYGVQV
jgi:hypothetical protein